MANKQTWQRLMSGYPLVHPNQQAAHDATVAAEWRKLNEQQRVALLLDDYRTRIWFAGYEAGQAAVRNREQPTGVTHE